MLNLFASIEKILKPLRKVDYQMKRLPHKHHSVDPLQVTEEPVGFPDGRDTKPVAFFDVHIRTIE